MAKGKAYNPLLKTYPDSDKINSVSEGAEVLYVRLIAASDDAGRYYGDPQWVLSKLFTARMIQSEVTIEDIKNRIDELEKVGLLRVYEHGGKSYIELFQAFKTLRNDVQPAILFPDPPYGDGNDTLTERERSVHKTCAQTRPDQTITDQTQRNGAGAEKKNGRKEPTVALAWSSVRTLLEIAEKKPPADVTADKQREWSVANRTEFNRTLEGLPPPVRIVVDAMRDQLDAKTLSKDQKRAMFQKAYREYIEQQ